MTDIVAFLAAQLNADEERLRAGWYGDVYWQALNNAAALGGWTAARQIDITVSQCDQITDAAAALIKERLQGWQQQEAEERLADIATKRQIIDEAFRHASKVDGEWGCCHEPDEIRAGQCEDQRPEDQPLLRLLARLYSGRPGYNEAWAHDPDDPPRDSHALPFV